MDTYVVKNINVSLKKQNNWFIYGGTKNDRQRKDDQTH